MKGSLITALGLGAVTGLRSFTGAACLARELSGRSGSGLRQRWWAARPERWLASPPLAFALQAIALGELVADKVPGVPARTAAKPLVGRAVIGAVLGAVVVDAERRATGAAAGAAAALAASFAGWWLRREANQRTSLPDAVFAVMEDAVAVAAAHELTAGV